MIDISTAALALTDRIETALQEQLPVFIPQRSQSEYPLEVPIPSAYIVGPEDSDDAIEAMGWPDCFVWIMPEGSTLETRGTGDGTTESYISSTTVWISIIQKVELGVDLPIRNGREITLMEFSRIKAEHLRGILMDVLPRYVPDCVNVSECRLEGSGVSDPLTINDLTYIESTVGITCRQHVEAWVSIS